MNDSTNLIFTRRAYPHFHTIRGVIVCIFLVYTGSSIALGNTFYLALNFDFYLILFSLASITSVFWRYVVRVEFDDERNQLIVTYPKYFFFRHDERIEYDDVGYIPFHELGVLKSTPTSLTHLKFYNKRTYIAQITTKRTSWKADWQSEDLEKMHAKLKTFAKEYKDSPGLI